MLKYLEIDSTYRNRNEFPNPAQFNVINAQNGTNFNLMTSLDPISLATPIVTYVPNDINALVAPSFQDNNANTSTSQVVAFSSAYNPSRISNYYVGLSMNIGTNLSNNLGPVLVNGWDYINTVGSDDCFRVTFTPSLSPLGSGETVVSVSFGLSTDFSIGTVFVPNGTLNSEEYVGYYVYNETLNQHATILSYDGQFALASINPPSSWNITDTISIRQELPQTYGTFQAGSTTSYVVLSLTSEPTPGYYNGSFLRITQVGSELQNIVCNIKYYSGAPTYVATLNYVLPVAPSEGFTYEILSYYKDSFAPLIYSGTQVQQEVCYEIQCVNLILPNVSVETGGIIQSYPYFLVDFQNFTTSNGGTVNVIYSNNPNTTRRLFKVPVTDITPSSLNSFVKLDKCYMAQIIKLTPYNSFKFGVYLPDGRPLVFSNKDTTSPLPPNPSLQVSALFSLRRIPS
jgi:hypothetical protein